MIGNTYVRNAILLPPPHWIGDSDSAWYIGHTPPCVSLGLGILGSINRFDQIGVSPVCPIDQFTHPISDFVWSEDHITLIFDWLIGSIISWSVQWELQLDDIFPSTSNWLILFPISHLLPDNKFPQDIFLDLHFMWTSRGLTFYIALRKKSTWIL